MTMNVNKSFTLPNLLTVLRILMVPFLVLSYWQGEYVATVILLMASGLTDIADGWIARHYHQISDLGKILDPIADKLTQFAVMLCLAIRHPILIPVVVIIFAKELLTLIGAVIFVRRGNATPYARWWGKLTTVILYGTMVLFVVSDLVPGIPEAVTVTAMSLSVASLVFSFLNYLLVYFEERHPSPNPPDAGSPEK